MAWRKWLVRSLVFTAAGALALAGFAYYHWTDPDFVRRQVIDKFSERLPGANVTLDSARLKLLGGIPFTELHLSRRDDPTKTDFIYVPSGEIYHDKEQLSGGKPAIRKIEGKRLLLHLIRGRDGHWNLENVLGPVENVAIPTFVFQQGTILFEDRKQCPDLPPLEIKDVNLTLWNDPFPTLVFKGTGRNDLLGPVQIGGTWGRISHEFTLSIQLPKCTVGGALVQRLAAYYPEVAAHARQLTGLVKLEADFHYKPQLAQPWHHEIHCQLTQGKWTHAQVPLPLENVVATVRCIDGQVTLEQFKAQSESTSITASGKAHMPALDADLDGNLEIAHLPLSVELFDKLPPGLQDVKENFQLQGNIGLSLELHCRSGRWRERCLIKPEDLAGVCNHFKYRLEHVRGQIDQELDLSDASAPVDLIKVDLVGYAGTQAVAIQGSVEGKKPAALDLEIRGKNIPIDQKLCAALQPEFQEIFRSFSPAGLADINAHIRRKQGETKLANSILVDIHHASMRYHLFPYSVEEVSGTLDIQPDHWEYRDFHGVHQGGEFRSRGGSGPTASGNQLRLEIIGTNVLLDEELKAALDQHRVVQNVWDKLAPSGRMRFEAHVTQEQKRCQEPFVPRQATDYANMVPDTFSAPDIAVIVTPMGCSIRPAFFKYDLTDLHGTVRYHHREVKLEGLAVRHGDTVLDLNEGKIFLHANGDVSIDLVGLGGSYIVPDAELFHALPPALAKACASLHLKDPVSLRTNMTFQVPADQSPAYIYWDGGLRLKNASLHAGIPIEQVSGVIFCRGEHHGSFGNLVGHLELVGATIFKQPFREIYSQIIVNKTEPDVVKLPNLKAKLFEGDVGGSIRLDFSPDIRYSVNLTAAQIQLEALGRHNHLASDARLRGLAAARLFLHGQGTDPSGLEGEGSFDVEHGEMYNLPVLLDLLKFLIGRWPDGTMFDEAHARFSVHGQRVDIHRLDLLGNAISLGGKGGVNLNGSTINMDLYAVWARVVQVSPPLLKELWPALSKFVLKIKMRGRIGDVHFEKVPVPILVDPVEKLLHLMAGRRQE